MTVLFQDPPSRTLACPVSAGLGSSPLRCCRGQKITPSKGLYGDLKVKDPCYLTAMSLFHFTLTFAACHSPLFANTFPLHLSFFSLHCRKKLVKNVKLSRCQKIFNRVLKMYRVHSLGNQQWMCSVNHHLQSYWIFVFVCTSGNCTGTGGRVTRGLHKTFP